MYGMGKVIPYYPTFLCVYQPGVAACTSYVKNMNICMHNYLSVKSCFTRLIEIVRKTEASKT